jgi:hypothetical protein
VVAPELALDHPNRCTGHRPIGRSKPVLTYEKSPPYTGVISGVRGASFLCGIFCYQRGQRTNPNLFTLWVGSLRPEAHAQVAHGARKRRAMKESMRCL